MLMGGRSTRGALHSHLADGTRSMLAYIFKRLVSTLPILLGIAAVSFLLMKLIPGDVVDILMQDSRATPEVRERLLLMFGLDQPLHTQFINWLRRAVHGDLGVSYVSRIPVTQEIQYALPTTLRLTIAAIVFASILGIPIGVMTAVRKSGGLEFSAYVVTLLWMSIPSFWLGILLLLLTSTQFNWVPPQGLLDISSDPLQALAQISLPAVSLGLALSAMVIRMTRSSMIETLDQDYVRTAVSKGLPVRLVVYKHALRNAIIPVITLIGLQFGYLLGGTIVIEEVFSLPGVGRLVLRAINQRDFPLLQGTLVFIGMAVVLLNLLVDIAYSILNPRIRYG